MESSHDKLSRVRKPRVHISYAVETEDAVVEKDLPFVVGVMGDFSGNPTRTPEPLHKRNFVTIDRDNFDKVMAGVAPELNLRVENTLAGDGSEMAVTLAFSKMEDFEPDRIVEQVEPLRRMMETRRKLQELLSRADRSPELEALLEEVLQNPDKLGRLSEEIDRTTQPGKDA